MPSKKGKNKTKKDTAAGEAASKFEWTKLPLEIKEETMTHMDMNQLLKVEVAMGFQDTPAAEYPSDVASPPKEMYRRIKHLLAFFDLDDGIMFQLMEKHDAIISGSCALAVILDSGFEPNDLDAYVKTDKADAFAESMIASTLYCMPSDRDTCNRKEYRGERNGIVKSYNLIHSVTGKRVNIIETSVCPISTVFAFYNTALMNFIAYWGVVCGYGALTCRRIGLFNSTSFNEGRGKTLAPEIEAGRRKYKDRGVKMIWNYRGREDVRKSWSHIRNHICGQWKYCPKTCHAIDDDGVACMVFPEWRDKDLEVTMITWSLATEGRCRTDFGMKLGWVHSSEGRCIWLL